MKIHQTIQKFNFSLCTSTLSWHTVFFAIPPIISFSRIIIIILFGVCVLSAVSFGLPFIYLRSVFYRESIPYIAVPHSTMATFFTMRKKYTRNSIKSKFITTGWKKTEWNNKTWRFCSITNDFFPLSLCTSFSLSSSKALSLFASIRHLTFFWRSGKTSNTTVHLFTTVY